MIHLLDRPGGRSLLGYLATRAARARIAGDIRIFYDHVWAHQSNAVVFADAPSFLYFPEHFDAWRGEAERWKTEAVDWWFHTYRPAPGDVVVDVGAGRGEHLLAFCEAVGPAGRVVAIEAHPESFEILCHFCRLNSLNNVDLVNCAVSDARGTIYIDTQPDWQGNTITVSKIAGAHRVEAFTLDELAIARDLPRIDLLKVNIEGAEKAALEGLARCADRVQNAAIACHDFRANRGEGESYRTLDAVKARPQALGFGVQTRTEHPRREVRDHLYASRRVTEKPPPTAG